MFKLNKYSLIIRSKNFEKNFRKEEYTLAEQEGERSSS
jgi:hypothetical protein